LISVRSTFQLIRFGLQAAVDRCGPAGTNHDKHHTRGE
jgi:hypothetical protein